MNGKDDFAGILLKRQLVELTILYEVSRALQKTVDEERALYTILVGVTAGRGLGFNRAFILLVDPEERHLKGRMAIGPSSPEEASVIWQALRDKHQSLGEMLDSLGPAQIKKDIRVNEIVSLLEVPLAGSDDPLVKILRSHEPCLATDGTFEPLGIAVGQDLVNRLGTSSFAVAPLYLAERDLGVLIADNAITGSPIDHACLKLLQIYGQQASAALQNTRLYRQLMEKISLCENTNVALRENQHHLLRAERLSTMGRMSSLLAHEIRTPLVAIGGFARRLTRSTPADDPRKEEMEIIVSEVTRLERMLEEVLGLAKLAKPEYRLVDANRLLRSVISNVRSEIEMNSIDLVWELQPDLPQVEVDESQLRLAVMNLVTNAIDAMPSGGTLRIETSLNATSVEIGVCDSGTGIHQEYLDKLFNPFFTTKTSGTGLGLVIVSQVVDNHSGSLRFESIPSQGTCFHIRLAFNPKRNDATTSLPSVAFTQEVTV